MAITRTAMVDDDGSGTTGTIINNAWKQEFYNQIDALAGAPWIDIPYSAGMFTAMAGTWTVSAGNLATFKYLVVGKLACFALAVSGSSNSAATARLRVTLPAGVPLPVNFLTAAITYSHAGGSGTGYAEFTNGSSQLNFLRDVAGTPWAITSGAHYLFGQWFYPIP